VRAGRPPVVLLGVRPFRVGYKHFAVVTGIDLGRGLVLLHDGADPDAPVEVPDFLERWERAGRWALVAVPPEAPLPPAFERLSAAERARLGWLAERAGDADAALAHYDAAVALDPALFAARANRGRLLLVRGRVAEAEAELRRALALEPRDVRAANNLACALLERAAGAGGADPAAGRAALLAEAEALARGALAAAPPELVGTCRDTLERVLREARRLAPPKTP